MGLDTEETFERLTQEFLDKMDAVECPAHEYRTGLNLAIEQLQVAGQASMETDTGGDDDGG
jgi:hypothetical protein